MNIAIISVKYNDSKYRTGQNLGMGLIDAYLTNQGHHVLIYDVNQDYQRYEDILSEIVYYNCEIVGFSCSFTSQIYHIIEVAELFRPVLPDTHFTIGGQGISFIEEMILSENDAIDTIIRGEGEKAICELAEALLSSKDLSSILGMFHRVNGEIIFNGIRNPNENLDELPFIDRKHILETTSDRHILFTSSRGCTGKCLFCSSGYFSNIEHSSKRWRYRSAESIVKEIQQISDIYGPISISFVDDNYLGGTQEGFNRALQFSRLVIKNKIPIKWAIECRLIDFDECLFQRMKDAGLCHVFIGIESGNREDQKLYNKRFSLATFVETISALKKLNITYTIGFIMFHPLSTLTGIIRNAEFLKKYEIASSTVLTSELSIYHGSPLIKYYEKKGLVARERYSIKNIYFDKYVNEVIKLCKKFLSDFTDIEVEIERKIYNCQSFNKSANLNNSQIMVLTDCKKELSSFEADLFLLLCKNIVHGDVDEKTLLMSNHDFISKMKARLSRTMM